MIESFPCVTEAVKSTLEFIESHQLLVEKVTPILGGQPLTSFNPETLHNHQKIHLSIDIELKNEAASREGSLLVASRIMEAPLENQNEKEAEQSIAVMEKQAFQMYDALKSTMFNILRDRSKNSEIAPVENAPQNQKSDMQNMFELGNLEKITDELAVFQKMHFQALINDIFEEHKNRLIEAQGLDKSLNESKDSTGYSKLITHYDAIKSKLMYELTDNHISVVLPESNKNKEKVMFESNILQEHMKQYLSHCFAINIQKSQFKKSLIDK